MATIKKFDIKPLSDHIIVRPTEASGEKKLASGIFLPAEGKDKLIEGLVIDVGPGRYTDNGVRIPLEVKKGDKVLFKKPSWEEPIKIDGEEYYTLSESSVIGIKT